MQWITLAVCVGGLGVAVAVSQSANGLGSGSGIVDLTSRLPVAGAYVRLGAHSGLKSDIARGPKSARSSRWLVERLKLASPCSPAIRLRRDEEFASSWGDRQGLPPTIDFVLPANDEPAAFELRHHEGHCRPVEFGDVSNTYLIAVGRCSITVRTAN
jgi:hypothetical protein